MAYSLVEITRLIKKAVPIKHLKYSIGMVNSAKIDLFPQLPV